MVSFLRGPDVSMFPLVFRKALSITPPFLSLRCLLRLTSMYINCTEEGERVKMKYHKTCFYFGKESCFHFCVMGGPPYSKCILVVPSSYGYF